MLDLNRIKLAAAVALLAATPALAAPSIESVADELAAAPAPADCVEKLPDGKCTDSPTSRQMVVPGARGSGPVKHVVAAAVHAVRRDISMTFLVGSAELTANAQATLDRFAKRLAEVAAYRPFTIEGHTDRSGTADANLKLSQARADSVVAYLAAKGIDQSKMNAKGYGFDKPLKGVPADSPSNRRVELVAN